MNNLYMQILSLEKDLGNDNQALIWFTLSNATLSIPSTPPPPSDLPSTGAKI
jgi:hypothetical protein